MSTLVLRSVKGSPLTSSEIDANVTNLNTDKADKASPTFTGAVTLPNSLLQVTASSYPTVQPTLNLDFANSKTVDPRITFVRNSTATYYDGQTTAMAEQNLLTYSQDFSNAAWGKINCSVSGGFIAPDGIAPDGTTTAALITANAGSGVHSLGQVSVLITGITYMVSVYVKAGTYSYFGIGHNNGLGSYIVNLTTGATVSGTGTATLVNGYYRLVTSVTPGGAKGVFFGMTDATGNSTFTAVGTETVYIWGAQAEQRSSATAYTPTTTAAITNYIPVLMTAPAGVPRLDYNPTTGQALGLLIEESRTNLLTYSQDFSNAAWTKINATVTMNTIVAPDGTLTGDKLVPDTTTNPHYIAPSFTPASGTQYSLHVYLKQAEFDYAILAFVAGGVDQAITFRLSVPTVGVVYTAGGTPVGTITSVGDGWVRATLTTSATSSTASGVLRIIAQSTNSTNASFQGNGYSGIYIWGAQLEAGAFSTSYIPTVASTVTRAADVASMTGTNFSSWYNQSQGSLFINYTVKAVPSFMGIWSITGVGNSLDTRIQNSSVLYYYYTPSSATQQSVPMSPPTANILSKEAISYSTSTIGVVTSTQSGYQSLSTLAPPPAGTALWIGAVPAGASTMSGWIAKLSYYPVALSSSNLVALTS